MFAVLALVIAIPAVAVAISPFVDVVPGAFYETPVNWAAANTITTGKDATHFAPDEGVTRGESVTFLKRYDDNITQPGLTGLGTRLDGLGQTVGTLSCTTNQVPEFNGSNWGCGTVTNTNTNTDALGTLSCASDQVARWDGAAWVCNTISPAFNVSARTATAVDTTGNVGSYTSVAVGADNLAIISYWDGTNDDLKVFHCADTACTTGTATTVDSANNVGQYTSIAIGTDGFAIISYWDSTNGDLKVFHCANTKCTAGTAGTPRTVDATGIVGRYTSIAIGTDGFAIISYWDVTNGDLKVFHCADTKCTAGTPGTPRAVDATGNVGQYTSIAIGTDGFAIISYLDVGNDDLKVFHCADTACTTGTTSAVDTTGNVGWYTSVAIGADGLAIISHRDENNGDLRVFHCTDTACATGTASAVDTTGNIGQYTSIAIGADGLAIISYHDTANGELKVSTVLATMTGITFG